MNPLKMQKMMKQMGMKMDEIDAKEVIIKCADQEIVLQNPQVIITEIMGKKVYQISGEEIRKTKEPKEEDIKIVMDQTGKDRDTVAQKLKELNNDLAKVILELKKE
ncbi:MAG: nascent polypeptide-associated complex protein [Candidatus Aenigmarchaeota archaeon]|nr:nascent polypeptide-associated complex protein [Candidatus Aenigmarchaeota archaeon]